MSVGLLYDDCFLLHDTGLQHPERQARLRAIREVLEAKGYWSRMQPIAFDAASADALARLHDADYVRQVEQASAQGVQWIDTPECPVSSGTSHAAMRAAGAAIQAADAVAQADVQQAFVLSRPPGHHAEHAKAMGFCYLGNAALAADHFIHAHGLSRVAVIDFDVHHGNGTQQLLEDRADVLVVSMHQDPATLWPGTGFAEEIGIGAGQGYTLNVPMRPGSGDAEYARAWDEVVEPKVAAFSPEALVVSAGFDAAAADPLAGMQMSTAGFVQLADRVASLADRFCGGRVVVVLEGGYDLEALSQGMAGCVGVWLGGV